jgi:hypothetical protein
MPLPKEIAVFTSPIAKIGPLRRASLKTLYKSNTRPSILICRSGTYKQYPTRWSAYNSLASAR